MRWTIKHYITLQSFHRTTWEFISEYRTPLSQKFCRKCNLPAFVSRLLRAGLTMVSLFYPEDGDDTFLRNVSWLSPDYKELYQEDRNLRLFKLF
jgi:hypothetical protein